MQRRRGDGSVSKRKDGRYEAAAFVRTPYGRQRVRRYAKTRPEAEALLVELRNKNNQGIISNTREQRLNDYMDYWLASKINNISQNTHTSYECTVRIHIKPLLGQKFLVKLSVQDVQQFLDYKLQLGESIRTIQKIRIVLSSVLQKAASEELITRNVARLTKIPTYRPKSVTPWNFHQLGIFLNGSKSSSYHPIYVLMALYGLRTGEVLGLSWPSVDFINRKIYIRNQIQYYDGKYVLTEPKTQAGIRELPLTNSVINLLSKIEKNTLGPLPDIIFKTVGNIPVDYNNLRRTFKQLSMNVGLPVITLHHLRHTAATNLKELGVPIKDAQSILGHAHITTTLQIYQHSDFIGKTDALKRYDSKIAEISEYCRQTLPSN